MHHTLRLYGRYREMFLRYYIFQAKWTRLPLLGNAVRAVAKAYGRNAHHAYLLTLEEANQVIDASRNLSLGPCCCRKVFRNCDNPINVEIVLGLGTKAFSEGRPGEYQEISKQEARDILLACHERRLLHSLVRCREDFYALCNCCPCCCVPLRLKQSYGIGSAWAKGNSVVEEFQRSLAPQD